MRSQEEAVKLVNEVCSKINYSCSEFEYIGTDKTMLPLTCNNGHSWNTTSFDSFVKRNTRCRQCHGKSLHTQESSEKRVSERCSKLNYKFKKFTYTNVDDTMLEIICDKNHVWNVSYYNFFQSKGCSTCSKIKRKTVKLSDEIVNERVNSVCKQRKFTYKQFVYTTAIKTIINLTCEYGHTWDATYNGLVNGGSGCPDCGGSKQKSQENVINDVIKKCEKNNYTFDNKENFVYKNSYSRLAITCHCGYSWTPTYQTFISIGSNCPKCAGCAKLTQQEAEQEVKKVCEIKKFEYEDFIYVGNKNTLINITCENGHKFKIGFNPLTHHKHGCATCAGQIITQEDAEKEVQRVCSIYGYTFEPFVYKNSHTKIPLICHCGHKWKRNSYSNFTKHHRGCPVCSGKDQKIAYINLISDENTPIALKYGIEKVLGTRAIIQNLKSVYNIYRIKSFKFENSDDCKNAEGECKTIFSKINKKELGRLGLITCQDMPDGHTETTYITNIDKIIEIYKKHGGVEI